MNHKPDYVCIVSQVIVLLLETNCSVSTAYCSCHAGLSGYYSHATATLNQKGVWCTEETKDLSH